MTAELGALDLFALQVIGDCRIPGRFATDATRERRVVDLALLAVPRARTQAVEATDLVLQNDKEARLEKGNYIGVGGGVCWG